VNLGQQKLIELLAGQRADVMVVGDDDQTIYEWRGAQPSYILREFRSVFSNKPHADYRLSHSLGLVLSIAQCAHNVITFNATRVEKLLIAHRVGQPAQIHIITADEKDAIDINKQLTREIATLVTKKGVKPESIAVLVRMYAQASGIQAEFLRAGIPYRVIGQQPFFERREIKALLYYILLATALNESITEDTEEWLLTVANLPSRMLSRDILKQAMRSARIRGMTLLQALEMLVTDPRSPLGRSQSQEVIKFVELLRAICERIQADNNLHAGSLLQWIVDQTRYLEHFDNYYGEGEGSYDRKQAVKYFIAFAASMEMKPLDFVQYVTNLDPTRGVDPDQQIVVTTVFRTKGLEYDYVIIPDCQEGYMPNLYGTGNRIFDKHGIAAEPEPSEAIENERRLFYVALTRAKKAVYIGAINSAHGGNRQLGESLPSRFLEEMRLVPTIAIMESLQRLANGDRQARADFLKSLRQYGGIRTIAGNLQSGYLRAFSDDPIFSEANKCLADREEQPFSYQLAYSSEAKQQANKGEELEDLPTAWRNLRL